MLSVMGIGFSEKANKFSNDFCFKSDFIVNLYVKIDKSFFFVVFNGSHWHIDQACYTYNFSVNWHSCWRCPIFPSCTGIQFQPFGLAFVFRLKFSLGNCSQFLLKLVSVKNFSGILIFFQLFGQIQTNELLLGPH